MTAPTKRYQFTDGNYVKELEFKLKPDTQANQQAFICSQKIKILAANELWACPDENNDVSISTDIQFKLSPLMKKIFKGTDPNGQKIYENQPINVLDNNFKMAYNLETEYVCKNSCEKELKLEEIEQGLPNEEINQKDMILHPSYTKQEKFLNLNIKNEGQNPIYGTVLQFAYSGGDISIKNFDPSAENPDSPDAEHINNAKSNNNHYCIENKSKKLVTCTIGCPISPNYSETYHFKIIFNEVLGDVSEYKIFYNLVKDDKILKNQHAEQSLSYLVVTNVESDLQAANPKEIDVGIMPTGMSQDREFANSFTVINDNQVASYAKDGMTILIEIPTQFNIDEKYPRDILRFGLEIRISCARGSI